MSADPSSTVRVALAQILSGPDPSANASLVEEYARAAKERGAELVVFPEASMRCFGEPLAPVAEPLGGPWATRIRDLAAELGVVIVVGMFSPSDAGRPDTGQKVRNTLLATDGARLWPYDKIHLFDALGFVESHTVEAGEELVVLDVGPAKIGLTTCYDVRFPWLYQELARRGAHALVVSASWGAGPRKADQWRLLTAARALDSTAYILACGQADPAAARPADGEDQAGSHLDPAAPTGVGLSRIVSPFGEVLKEAGAAPELVLLDLDLDLVAQARAALPVLAGSAKTQALTASTGKVSL